MRAAVSLLSVLVLVVLAVGQPRNTHIAESPALDPADEVKQFTVPPGFEVQLVASEPDIDKPMNICFDDRGRLWVTCSVEYPFPAAEGKARDRVVILEDFAPNGKARKATTWRADCNIPIGLLPVPARPNEAIVHSIPSVWRMRDTQGKGTADDRAVLLRGYGVEDTHGMTNSFLVGFEGLVYACHGFKNTSKIQGDQTPVVTLNSGNTYRFSVDGKRLEQYTWGQVNPFGLAMDPRGFLYSADCHSRPVYQLIRGAYYPSFGKPHDGLGYAPEMCKHDHGSTAICGIVYYDADHFPAEYRNTLFIGNVVTNRVNFDKLGWQGSSPVAEARPDFLTSKDPWFRPVDIKLGPDGALYIADFYNRIIGHYEVDLKHPGRDRQRGRIWRVVYKGTGQKLPADPRPEADRAPSADLVADLAHPNMAVRMRATHLLAARQDATGKLEEILLAETVDGSSWSGAHALWVLERRGTLRDDVLKAAVNHKGEAIRLHAARVLSERAKLADAQREHLTVLLADSSPFVQRCAADAMGQHANTGFIRPLLNARHKVEPRDSHLLHTVRVALRNQFLDGTGFDGLGQLKPEDEKALADVALAVPRVEAAAFLVRVLPNLGWENDPLANVVRHISRYGEPAHIEKVLAWARQDKMAPRWKQITILKGVEKGSQERGSKVPDSVRAWAGEILPGLLASKEDRVTQAAGEIVGALKLTEAVPGLQKLADDSATPLATRQAALNALVSLDAGRHAPQLGKILSDTSLPIEFRERMAETLARSNTPAGRQVLTAALATVHARLQTTIAAGLAGSKDGAGELFRAVEAGKASPRLLREKAVEVKLQQSNLPGWQGVVAKLTQGLPPAEQRLAELIAARSQKFSAERGDADRGKAVFGKHCANCHQIGGQGAKVGPQLDGLGLRGLERILEDTIDPNRNIDAAFRTTVLNLKNGQVLSGLVLREEGEIVVLADNLGKEVRVPKGTIEERTTAAQSPMPANLIDQIPEREYLALIAYLLAQRPKE